MSSGWYYTVMGVQIGPLTSEDFRRHAREGKVSPSTYVRRGVEGRWVTADQVRGLFDQAPQDRVPQPSPATMPDNVASAEILSSDVIDEVLFGTVIPDTRTAKSDPAGVAEDAGGTDRLRPCPDCDRSISKRATQCPHCGCPLTSSGSSITKQATAPSSLEVVFAATVRAIRDLGYAVQSLDRANGVVAFRTKVSWASWGQEVSLIVMDNGDGSCSFDMTHSFQGLTDWGEGGRIAEKIADRVRSYLSRGGASRLLR